MIITQPAQNRQNIIARLKTKRRRPLGESNPQLFTPQSTFLALFFRHIQRPGLVAEWWNVCIDTPHSGGPFSSVLACPRTTTHAPFAQTTPAPLLGLRHVATMPGRAELLRIKNAASARIMNELQTGRLMTTEIPSHARAHYVAAIVNDRLISANDQVNGRLMQNNLSRSTRLLE